MNNLLGQFNNDFHTRDALMEFFSDYVDAQALDKLYKGEDVSHVKQAKELIMGAFDYLKDLYAIPTKPKEEDSAR